jgi:hypothetical protein
MPIEVTSMSKQLFLRLRTIAMVPVTWVQHFWSDEVRGQG